MNERAVDGAVLIKQFNQLTESYGSDYHHYGITGHFGGRSNNYSKEGIHNSKLQSSNTQMFDYKSKEQYTDKWWDEEKKLRRFFSILSREYTGIRNWGKSSRHLEMKVICIPEIQQTLHLHGILSIPKEMNDFQILAFNNFANKEWRKIYVKGSFLITKKTPIIRNDNIYTWEEYITKKIGYGDIVNGNIIHLPFKK